MRVIGEAGLVARAFALDEFRSKETYEERN